MSYKRKRNIKTIISLIEEIGIKSYLQQYIDSHEKLHGLVKIFKANELIEYLKYDEYDITNEEKYMAF